MGYPLNRQNWGEYIRLLKDNGAAKEVTDHLQNIKENYRNPLMHPEDILELHEAASLFAVCQSIRRLRAPDIPCKEILRCAGNVWAVLHSSCYILPSLTVLQADGGRLRQRRYQVLT